MAAVLYSNVADLKTVLSGTDSGTGTPAELSTAQLTLALQSASDRVSVYFGTVMDSSTPQSVPPAIFADLTLDLAAFFAWRTYLKGKALPSDHPAFLAYTDAMGMLKDARDGVLRLDPVTQGAASSEVGKVINRIPQIFTGHDSNTEVNRAGVLVPADPTGPWAGGLLGAVEQG